MSFVSLRFLGFILLALTLYYAIPKRAQWWLLLVASYAFYLFSGLENLVYIILTTLTVYGGALAVEAVGRRRKTPPENSVKRERQILTRRKRWVVASVMLINFGALAYVKYYAYLADAVNAALLGGVSWKLPATNILLPLGISFFTFQSVGYLIDVYRGKVQPERNPAKFALFVSFFPQIIQGPIGRYDALAPQLTAPHALDGKRLKQSLTLMLWGYFKKMVIADRLAYLVAAIFTGWEGLRGAQVFMSGLIYGVQIYCDFSGGIDVTRGVARAFGVNLAQNFMQPFFANTLPDFWRRWHITLGAWMRDYVFYTLALSKRFTKLGRRCVKRFGLSLGKVMPTCVIAFINFLLIGIWHGPNMKYVAFGLWNGTIIALGMLTQPFFDAVHKKLRIDTRAWWYRALQTARTLLLVTIGRIIARSADWKTGLLTLRNGFFPRGEQALFGEWLICDGMPREAWYIILACVALLLAVGVLKERGFPFQKRFDRLPVALQSAFVVITILVILVFGVYGIVYNSASFLYGGY